MRTIIKSLRLRSGMFVVMTAAVMALWSANLEACTAFYLKGRDKVLVGNNEDGTNPDTRVWFVPGEAGKYGRMYVGYADLSAQGGVNERGLWFDAFGLKQSPQHMEKFIPATCRTSSWQSAQRWKTCCGY